MAVLLFDLFGVLACHQSARAKAEIERVAGIEGERFWGAYWKCRYAYDSGDHSAPQYWRAVADDLGATFDARRVTDLVEADMRSWSEVDDDMIGYLGELSAAGHRLGLLSNITADLADEYERRHGWLDLFSVRAFSCRIGVAKPHPDAYRWCVVAFGVPASDVLFIDDRAENVRGAIAAGLRGHLFTSLPNLRSAVTCSSVPPPRPFAAGHE